MEGEIRQNKITKQWTIYAPGRRKRPQDFRRRSRERESLPEWEKGCPFCPGNEHLLPPIIMELPAQGRDRWQTRVVPNKFPALTPDASAKRMERGIYLTMGGYGQHEVIIESSRHDRGIAQMSAEEVAMIIETYHRRYVDLMKTHQNMMSILFRNHGLQAGTSLIHPHSQLIVTGMVPHYIRWREEAAQRYFDEWGRCVYCDLLEWEMADRRRVVLENTSFAAFVPFAADVPFEIWIMPKNHQADFGAISEGEKADLTIILQRILATLHEKLQDPDYNYVIHTAARYREGEPQLHWYLEIRPRLTTPAGFEMGSGISINPSIPEEDADFLKGDGV